MKIGYLTMGNSVLGGFATVRNNSATITKFYTSNAWIEGRAEDQLDHIASLPGVRQIAAFPDLHPGKYGPVGCAILADRIYPQFVGSDIGCGMSLFKLDLEPRKIRIEKAARRLRLLGDTQDVDHSDRLRQQDLPPNLFDTALGTIGGGNHFCELQTLAECDLAKGLDKSASYLLVHSGSRGLGNAILNGVPQGAYDGMDPDTLETQDYLRRHNQAVTWASLNRRIIAERAAMALRADLHLIVDTPHNLLRKADGGWLHRKGAAVATGLTPLAGSRATPSYLMQTIHGAENTLGSSAHGAGRKYDRTSMHGRIMAKKSNVQQMQRNPFGGQIICEDKALLIEESPRAYKSAKAVAADLQATGVARIAATLHPLITFKKLRQRGQR